MQVIADNKIIHPAYIAGVLDSDGSLTITKRNLTRSKPSYCCMFQLSWTETENTLYFMEYLKKYYGGSYHRNDKKYKADYKNSKPIYKYCLTDIGLEKLLLEIKEFLVLKIKQADNIIEARSIIEHTKCRKDSISRRLEELYVYNKTLNSKNKRNPDRARNPR